MGWATGSELANDTYKVVRRYIPEKARKRIARKIIDLFQNHDADDWQEYDLIVKDAELEKEEYEY